MLLIIASERFISIYLLNERVQVSWVILFFLLMSISSLPISRILSLFFLFLASSLEILLGITNLILGIQETVIIPICMVTIGLLCSLISLMEIISFSSKKGRNLCAETNSKYAVELIDVYKDYITGSNVVHALRGITLRIRKGEFVAIMGPSGSGKTTLLNIIGALDRPTKGKVYIDGIDLSKLTDEELSYIRNRKIGFVFQAFNLINRTSVLRNITLPAIIAKVPKKERIKRAKELIKILGLDESMLPRRPVQLSGGQQQRVAIARALINNPSIILADEPTGNLDSKTGAEIMKYLRLLNEKFGTTIIVVTHNRMVAEMADRILYIKDGKIVGEEVLRKKQR